MAASVRLMLLMSPEELASLDLKARTLRVSAGEVVRRAVQAFEVGSEKEAAERRALIHAFNKFHPETLRIADQAHRKLAEIPPTRELLRSAAAAPAVRLCRGQ